MQEINNKEEWWFDLGYYNNSYFSNNKTTIFKNKEYFDLCFLNSIDPFDALNKFGSYIKNKR